MAVGSKPEAQVWVQGAGSSSGYRGHAPPIPRRLTRQLASQTPASLEAAGRRVLVVEDNPDGADTLARLLRVSGHDVRTAGDGSTALEAAGVFQPEVILLDIGLPGMTDMRSPRSCASCPAWPRCFSSP